MPINADFEGGFAVDPEGVARNVVAATDTGIAGLSIEDSTSDAAAPLFDFSLAVERVRAAREAIDRSGTDVVLTARSEGFIVGRPDLDETIAPADAYAEAGADCLYAPGIRDALTRLRPSLPRCRRSRSTCWSVAGSRPSRRCADLGVRRISVGGALARAAWSGFLEAAKEIAEPRHVHRPRPRSAVRGSTASLPDPDQQIDRWRITRSPVPRSSGPFRCCRCLPSPCSRPRRCGRGRAHGSPRLPANGRIFATLAPGSTHRHGQGLAGRTRAARSRPPGGVRAREWRVGPARVHARHLTAPTKKSWARP